MRVKTDLLAPRLSARLLIACLLASVGLFLASGGARRTRAQGPQGRPITGQWLVDFDRKEPDTVSLSIVRGDPHRGDGTRSDGPIALSELQGLTREQAFGTRQPVRFRIVREGGTFDCEGTFTAGHGAGSWTLTPDARFVAAMRERGYAMSSDKELFESALFSVSIKALDDLKAAGYDRLPFDKVIETRIFEINPELIGNLRAAGYAGLTIDELVEARIFKIDAKYIEDVRALGFGVQSFHQLVDMRSQNVTADYVREMRAAGFNLSPRELVDFKVFNVTTAFIRELRSEGLTTITPREIVDFRVFHIDADFIRRARAKGFANPTPDQLVEMRMNGKVK